MDAAKFRAGSDLNADIYFDPLLDPSAKDRAVLFSLLDDGWYVQSTGAASAFVNQSVIVGMMRIRSGAIVRMSEFGPEFEFIIAPRGRPNAQRRESASSALSLSMSGSLSTLATSSTVLPSAPPPVPPSLAKPSPSAPRASQPGRWGIWVGGILVLALLLVAILRQFVNPPAPGARDDRISSHSGTVAARATAPTEGQKKDTTEIPPIAVGNMAAADAPSKLPSAAPATKTGPSEDSLRAKLDGAVLLIEVERNGHFWPFATCSAVGPHTVLTSAREAYRLAVWRQAPAPSYRFWAVNPATGAKWEVEDIRLHRLFIGLGDKSGEWIYSNLAMLTVRGDLPKMIEVATDDELAGLKEGRPVFSFGFTHDGDPITSEDRLEPKLTRGKIFLITAERNLPGQPSVLHVKAEMPKFSFGSPVVDGGGKLVAIYGEAAPIPGGEGKSEPALFQLHYATVVNPNWIDLWLKKADDSVWVSAADLKLPLPTKTNR